MKCILVSHTHWDREWYRTFQQFRARLVDAVDRVLELCEGDPDYRFVLDGQAIVLEDYLAIRPGSREALERFVRGGQIAIGPWYVQPDSLIPSGEAHLRNLLEGRRVASGFGPVSSVAYTPDSFGHPAQFPQLLSGFGFRAFVYWRGNGDEIAELPSEYRWEAPDGSAIPACHLGRGYFAAAALPRDPEKAVARLRPLAEKLRARATADQVILMNGVDHQVPDAHTREVAEALAKATGWEVRRGVFEDFVEGLAPETLPPFRGELVGGHLANLLPGVWSTRTWLKLRSRACEAALEGWAEPWAAVGHWLALPDERPALRLAWRELLANQAHDSICGCSRDAVHEQMRARYDASLELARETARRTLDRIAGLPAERQTPWADELELAVFNPSPHPRSDWVRFRIDPAPAVVHAEELTEAAVHPLILSNLRQPGYAVDGEPARVVTSEENGRYQLLESHPPLDVEFLARDVPALGWKRVALRRAPPRPDRVDDGREIECDGVAVAARDDGTLDVRFGDRRFEGQGALEDLGDRGDSYDFDPVEGGPPRLLEVRTRRTRHDAGLEVLEVERTLRIPARLDEDRRSRSRETSALRVRVRASLVRGLARVGLAVRVENAARDHRLRMLFPTGRPVAEFRAASTFDVARRTPGPVDASRWVHAAPSTFPHQGWICAGGLTVAAPGLCEGEVRPDGVVAVTLLRCVGWLSRMDLATRPEGAGPSIPTPGAQCEGPLEAELALFPGEAPRPARDAELGLAAVVADARPRVPPGRALLALEPRGLLLSALKPAEDGDGAVVRVQNPGDVELDAELQLGLPVRSATAVELDESAVDRPVVLHGQTVRFPVPPRALRSVRLR